VNGLEVALGLLLGLVHQLHAAGASEAVDGLGLVVT
jgi:hypothetical protein